MELLVVVAILALLIGILVPSLSQVRMLAKVARTKAELAGIGTALLAYRTDQKSLPPSRTYCEYGPPAKVGDWGELPPELGTCGYYGAGKAGTALTLNAADPFNPGRTYKYLKPGKGFHNNATTYVSLWVPSDFPNAASAGKEYSNEKDSPVTFVLFSLGTITDTGYWNALAHHLPCDSSQWYGNNRNGGIVARTLMPSGSFEMSP